ncbi:unnamed protein product, partial [marine sediment metagenome]
MAKYQVEIKWGVIFSVVALVWMIFEKTMGWHSIHIDKHATYTMLFFPIAILVYLFALREKRSSLGNLMTWKEGFKSGIIIGFIVALIAPLNQFIFHKYISPDYFSNVIQYSVTNDLISLNQAEEFFTLKNYI